jgi:hypothetical protein
MDIGIEYNTNIAQIIEIYRIISAKSNKISRISRGLSNEDESHIVNSPIYVR